MKTKATILTAFIAVLLMTHSTFAGEPFTSQSTGADWRAASLDYRKSYCERMAAANQKLAPGITGEFIFDSLQEFYTSDDPNILKQKITEIVALTVTLHAKQRE